MLCLIYLLIVNAAGCLVMLIDKRKAIHQKYRIPEATLMLLALCGASLGCYCGMKIFHHKARKPLFAIGLPIIIGVQTIIIVIILPFIL